MNWLHIVTKGGNNLDMSSVSRISHEVRLLLQCFSADDVIIKMVYIKGPCLPTCHSTAADTRPPRPWAMDILRNVQNLEVLGRTIIPHRKKATWFTPLQQQTRRWKSNFHKHLNLQVSDSCVFHFNERIIWHLMTSQGGLRLKSDRKFSKFEKRLERTKTGDSVLG